MTRYVLGFLFSPDDRFVVLLKKNRPAFQKGKWNGVGGHIEESDGSPDQAMSREFREETGVNISAEEWETFAVVTGDGFHLTCLRAASPLYKEVRTKTDEQVDLFYLKHLADDACERQWPMISNLRWLLTMAHVRSAHDWPYFVVERSNSILRAFYGHSDY